MDKCREAFEKKFPIPAHWIEFDEKRNKYYCPYVADAKASEYQEMWEVWQSRQAEIDQLKGLLEKDKYAHNLYYENANLQTLVEEKDKRITGFENKLLNLASMYSTKAAEFNIKDEQELATVCNQISQGLEKALRGDND